MCVAGDGVIVRVLGERCLAVVTHAGTHHTVAFVAVQLDSLTRVWHVCEDS